MAVSIQGKFCGSPGLSDPVYGSGGGHPNFFCISQLNPGRAFWKRALFLLCTLWL